MQEQAREILRRIVPWLLESNSKNVSLRKNYKGVQGRIGFVGGARDYAGAPYFASMSALRLGADLSYVICSNGAGQAIKNYSPDLIVTPLLDVANESEFDKEMSCLLDRLHALVVGPGLGREDISLARAKKLITQAKLRSMPIILDADSLLLVYNDPTIVKSYSRALLTPNRIEMQRLLNSLYAPETFDLRNLSTNKIRELVQRCSTDLDVAILAKGMVDIICDNSPKIELLTDELSGSNRRCGGQGDITCGLAGVYCHWIEQTNKTSQNKIENPMAWSAYLAAITTRRSNELAYEEHRGGTLASDMVGKVQVALQSFLKDKPHISPTSDLYTGFLSKDEINRYRRQMIMEEFGPDRQMNLKKSSALIIGAGGLGCPAAVYLGAGGIGRLGVVDDDRVEASNLHRQILHNMDKVGMLKTESIKQSVAAINPNVEVVCHSTNLNRHNAVELIEGYDIVIDCTDNLLTRYMISDACVVAKKPLVSGAALKMDGQLTVYNFDEETPCFRCLFPVPPPPNAVGSCSDNGVLGVLPGIIGVQQALEAMKIAGGIRPSYAGKMLLFDGQLGFFRHITISKRRTDCEACGKNSNLGRDLIDYDEFCGKTCQKQASGSDILNPNERINIEQYREILNSGRQHVLVDVRPLTHSNISRFRHAIQAPVKGLLEDDHGCWDKIRSELRSKKTDEIYVVCRLGIASQRGTRILQDRLKSEVPNLVVKDIVGGMTAWSKIDPENYSCL